MEKGWYLEQFPSEYVQTLFSQDKYTKFFFTEIYNMLGKWEGSVQNSKFDHCSYIYIWYKCLIQGLDICCSLINVNHKIIKQYNDFWNLHCCNEPMRIIKKKILKILQINEEAKNSISKSLLGENVVSRTNILSVLPINSKLRNISEERYNCSLKLDVWWKAAMSQFKAMKNEEFISDVSSNSYNNYLIL